MQYFVMSFLQLSINNLWKTLLIVGNNKVCQTNSFKNKVKFTDVNISFNATTKIALFENITFFKKFE